VRQVCARVLPLALSPDEWREEEGSPAAKKIHIKVKRGKTGPGWLVRGARRRGYRGKEKWKKRRASERAREARREFARVLFLLPCSGSALTFSPPFGFPVRPSIPPEPAGSCLAGISARDPQTAAASRSRRAPPSTETEGNGEVARRAIRHRAGRKAIRTYPLVAKDPWHSRAPRIQQRGNVTSRESKRNRETRTSYN
jgi:hypothetical protein